MTSRRLAPILAVLLLSPADAFAQAPSNADIHTILKNRLWLEDLGIGIVVGVIDGGGRRVVSFGSLAKNDKRPLNGDTVFEIGSITKEFTSLLLTDMVRRGEVALTDPVAKFLPPGVTMPERGERKITLADLSTHSSGLRHRSASAQFEVPAFEEFSVRRESSATVGPCLTLKCKVYCKAELNQP